MPKFKIEDLPEEEILKHLRGDIDESEWDPEVKKIIERIDTADNLIKRYGRRTCAKMLSRKFNYSLRSAYLDISRAEYFFGSMHKPNKEYYRRFLVDILVKALIKASKDEDADAIAKLAGKMSDTLGLDLADSKIPDWSDIKIQNVRIGFYPHITGTKLEKNYIDEIADILKDIPDLNVHEILKNQPKLSDDAGN